MLDIAGLCCTTNTVNIAGVPLYRPLGTGTAVHQKTLGQFSPSSFFFSRWIERYDWSGFEEPQVFYSDPRAAKQFEEQNRKRAEERLRLAVEQSFSTALMQLIEAKGKDHVEVYKRANIDRKLFSKIRTQHEYIPSKKTIIALALALELSLDETQKLLEKAGFTLSRSILFDVIIEYFISQGKYDIFEVNSVLLAYEQPILS